MDTFYKVTSFNKEKECNNIKPFNFNDLEGETNPITNRVMLPEDINVVKNQFIRINKNSNSEIKKCCDPKELYDEVNKDGKPNNNYNIDIYNLIKNKYPKIREIKSTTNNNILKLELSTNKDKEGTNWEEITPYHICKYSFDIDYKNTLWHLLMAYDINNLTDLYVQIKKVSDDTISLDGEYLQNMLLSDCISTSCTDEKITINHLLDAGKSDLTYSYYDDTKVIEAVKSKSYNSVKNYLQKYNSVNNILTNDDRKNRIIHIAAEYYSPDIFDLLLALNTDLNVQNAYGNTPLHVGVMNGNFDVIDKLVKSGCKVNIKNKKGETACMLSLKLDDSRKIRDNIKNNKSNAIYRLNFTMLRYLYNNGSNILLSDNDGNNFISYTILYSPDHSNKKNIIEYLIQRGVDIEGKNNKNNTPLEIADLELKKELKDKPYIIENGVNEINYNELTNKQKELYQIQRIIFNKIIETQPQKYNKYINVSEIPKGAPIEVLYDMCSGTNPDIIGLEDTKECTEKGGQMVKIDNPTTMVKLELIPESEMHIENIDSEELYTEKYPKKIMVKALPEKLVEFNKRVRESYNSNKNNINNKNNNKNNKKNNNKINSNNFVYNHNNEYVSRDEDNSIKINKKDLSGEELNLNQVNNNIKHNNNDKNNKKNNKNNNNSNNLHPNYKLSNNNLKEANKNGVKNANSKQKDKKDNFFMNNLIMIIVFGLLLVLLIGYLYMNFNFNSKKNNNNNNTIKLNNNNYNNNTTIKLNNNKNNKSNSNNLKNNNNNNTTIKLNNNKNNKSNSNNLKNNNNNNTTIKLNNNNNNKSNFNNLKNNVK